jgi:Penicillin binding protein transpeptidase domain
MSYAAASRQGLGKGRNDGWFVGFAPRRNPEIVVAAMVQDTMEHGGAAAGPVVRDIVKAYYDKKNKKNPGELTAENKSTGDSPKMAAKPEETAAAVVVSAGKKKTE